MPLTNLSFETAGSNPGEAGSWTWTRSDTAFSIASYATLAGWGHVEGFELFWRLPNTPPADGSHPGNETAVLALVVPTNAQPFIFGSSTGTPSPQETFERAWHKSIELAIANAPPANPTVISTSVPHGLLFSSKIFIRSSTGNTAINGGPFQVTPTGPETFTIPVDSTGSGAYTGGGVLDLAPPDAMHPGNETAEFVWDRAQADVFSLVLHSPTGITFEPFDVRDWSGATVPATYFFAFASTGLLPATFDLGAFDFDDFEEGWNNDTYQFVMGATTPATFVDSGTHAFENFEAVKADQAFAADFSTSTFTVPTHGFVNGDEVSLYSGVAPDGTPGVLPSGINPLLTYFVISATTNTFKLSLTSGGAAIGFVDNGTGAVFVKANRALFWTLTDVGL